MSSTSQMTECSVDGCCRSDIVALGLCGKHYQYQWRHGIPEPVEHRVPMHLIERDAAWLAAVLDCEGWIGMSWNNRKHGIVYWPRLGVGNTSYALIERLIAITGVDSVRYVLPKNVKAKEQWHWIVNKREDVDGILLAVLPHLVVKRAQAEAILSLPMKNARDADARKFVHDLCRKLNKKGRPTNVND